MKKLFWIAVAVAAFSARLWAGETQRMTWTVGGIEREALVCVPSGGAEKKMPVIFAFHGHGSSMKSASGMAFQRVWPEALVVYMQGLPTVSRIDPAGRESGWQGEPGEVQDRDLKFFDAVLSTLRGKYPVDDRRIYATGFSNGGSFVFLLWAERGRTFAALAPCAGRMPAAHPSTARPLLYLGGESDPIVKRADQLESIEVAKSVNGCKGAAKSMPSPSMSYYASRGGTPVVMYAHPGGHVYPKAATMVIVSFFKNHSL